MLKKINQKGIAPVMLLVGVAALVAIGVIAYVLVTSPSTRPAQVELKTFSKEGEDTSDCKDTDYQGCDEAAEHATWKDDGKP